MSVLAWITGIPVRIVDTLFGYDFFISYRQQAAGAYAAALQQQLRRRPHRFSVFRDLDPEGFVVGRPLNQETERAVGSATAILALVDRTAFAEDSVYMPLEVLRFERNGRLIVPVDLEGCLRQARHDAEARRSLATTELTRKMLDVLMERINVEETSFAAGAPSAAVVAKLGGSLTSVTRSVRRIRFLIGLGVFLFGLAVTAGSLAVVALKQNESLRLSLRTNYARLGDNNWQQGVTARDFKQSPLEAAHYFDRSNGYYVRAENSRAAQVSLVAAEALWGCPMTAAITIPGEVDNARYLKDNRRVLTLSRDPSVSLWDIEREARIALFPHGGIINGARLDANEEQLLTWGAAPAAKLWRVAGCALVREFPHKASVSGARFHTSGTEILTWSDDGTARRWKISQPEPMAIFPHKRDVNGALFTRDDGVVTWSTDGTAKLWKATVKEPIATFSHGGPVFGAAIFDDGRRFITVGQARAARLWDLEAREFIGEFPHDHGDVRGAGTDKAEARLLTWNADALGDGQARLWDIETNELIARFPHGGESGTVNGARFTSDETQLLTWGDDGLIKLWRVDDQALVATFSHSRPVHGVVLNKAETILLTWSLDDAAKLWDFRAVRPLAVFTHGRMMAGAVFDSSESKVLTWSDDGTVRQWDITHRPGRRPLFSFDPPIVRAGLNKKQTRLLTITEDGTVRELDAITGREIAKFPHGGRGVLASLDAREKTLLTWGSDNVMKLWDAVHPKEIAAVPFAGSILKAEALVGRSRIVTRSRNADSVQVWDVATGKMVGALRHEKRIIGDTPSPDGRRLLTWSEDKTGKLWDVANCKLLATYAHDDWVQGGMFTKNGKTVLTWGNDKAVKFWAVAGGKLISEFRTNSLVLHVDLSRDENRMLVGGASRQLELWNIRSHKLIESYTDDLGINGRFDRGERRVLTWSPSGKVKLWRVGQRDPIATFDHGDRLVSAMFDPAERWILTRGVTGITKLWALNRKDPVAEIPSVDLFFGMFNRDGTRLLGCGRRGVVELANLAPRGRNFLLTEISDDDLAIDLEVRSGTRLDSFGTVNALPPSAWHERQQKLAGLPRRP